MSSSWRDFLADEDQWKKCAADWPVGLGRRKHLHMNGLRWTKPERHQKLLSTLGPIPHAAGLRAVFSSVKVSDYDDLVDGTALQKLIKGYYIVLLGIIDVISKQIPADETFKLVLEAQIEYQTNAGLIFNASAGNRTPDGRRKLVSLDYVPKEECSLTEPADLSSLCSSPSITATQNRACLRCVRQY